MKRFVPTVEAYRLYHEGTIALAQIEANGIRVDTDYLDRKIDEVRVQVKEMEDQLKGMDEWKQWKRRFGQTSKLGSHDQLGKFVFETLGLKRNKAASKTDSDKESASELAFANIELPFVRLWFQVEKLKKALSTYLLGIKRETVDGFCHPNFNLHLAVTYRSSCDNPNFQNMPVRNPVIMKLIRDAFIARDGYQLGEIDFAGIEVRSACVYTKDPRLIEEFTTEGKDPHGDTARQLFLLTREQVDKKTSRQCAKNQFVFPQFFGSVYFQCAPLIWDEIIRCKYKLPGTETLLIDHLKSKGITKLGNCEPGAPTKIGSFVHHLREIENGFWNERFKAYTAWKRSWWKTYQQRGGFKLLTGVVCWGVFKRNEVLNYPIQGCLQGHVRVLTENGHIPIKDLMGKEVRVWTGFKWADAMALDRGKCRTAKIKLSSGLTIDCDTRHKLKNENDKWVEFADLKVGDRVALPVTSPEIPPSREMTWEFVLGFLTGDGYLGKRKGSLDSSGRYVQIIVGRKKLPELKAIYSFLTTRGHTVRKFSKYPEGHSKQYGIRVESKKLASYLVERGMVFGARAKEKRVPNSIWTGTILQRRNYLEGLWKSDGSRGEEQKGNIHSPNLALLRDVMVLMAPLGFDGHISTTEQGFLLRVSRRRKNAKSHRKYPASAIARLVEYIDPSNYEYRNEQATDIRAFRSGKDVSQYIAERILDNNSAEFECAYRYDTITAIEIGESEETTYTMSVDDHLHQFVADGVIHKNTAFHWLLWTITELQKWLRKHKMKTKIVGQIHDSIVADIFIAEKNEFLAKCHDLIANGLPEHWDWINVPLEVEMEVSPVGGTWAEKQKVDFK